MNNNSAKMNGCKSCQHWEQDKSTIENIHLLEDELAYPDLYEGPPRDWPEIGECKSPKLLFYKMPPTKNHASIVDGTGYAGRLITASDFGCVNWELAKNHTSVNKVDLS